MRITVDTNQCVGCELCEDLCPEVFEVQGGAVRACAEDIPLDLEAPCRQAAEECPTDAIAIEELGHYLYAEA